MGASHKIVAAIGLVASLVLAFYLSTLANTLGADASDGAYTGLWIYTPYVDPTDRVSVKMFLQGGDGIVVRKLHASIGDVPIVIEDRHDRERRPSKRFDMGKLDIELLAVVPTDMALGEHRLAFDLETSCAGSDYSKACGSVHLEAPIQIGGTIMSKLLAVLRAIGAALFVFFVVRRGWDPLKRWVNVAEKSAGAILAPTFIALIIVWAWCAYPFFARPLGAALGSSSDVLYGVAIVGWLAVWPVAVRTRGRGGMSHVSRDPPSHATARLLLGDDDDDEAVIDSANAGGYRAAPAVKKPEPRPRTSLDDLAAVLYGAYRVRYRRSGDRLLPRWFGSAPVTFDADAGDDVSRGFRMTGHYGYILVFAITIAARFGRLELTVDGKTVVVEKDDTAESIKARLSPS